MQQRQGSALPATSRLRCSHSPHRESKNVQPCGIQPVITAERKKAHMLPVTPYFDCVRNGRGFIFFCVLIGTQDVFRGIIGREKHFRCLSSFCCNIYSVGLVLWVYQCTAFTDNIPPKYGFFSATSGCNYVLHTIFQFLHLRYNGSNSDFCFRRRLLFGKVKSCSM